MRALAVAALIATTVPQTALAQADDTAALRAELSAARAELAAQRARIAAQETRLQAPEARLAALPVAGAVASAAPSGNLAAPGGIERVGAAPSDFDRPAEVAVLGDQGSVITRAGQLTAELNLDYTRADRNRAVFRGIEVVESVLVGVFDINESRQDILSAALGLRYGVTGRLELGARLPFVHRADSSVLAPIAGSTGDDAAASITSAARGTGLGDIELSARYQLTRARADRLFIIANLQGVIPTGTNPFSVPRDGLGRALKAATGAGFYGISPSITAILPSDPVVLFGTLGYTVNLARSVNTRIPPVQIDRVDPGDAMSASAGIGIAFNPRTTMNFGYAHSWALGTRTTTRPIDDRTGALGDPVTTRSRDLQIGRLLFGVTYRLSGRASVNWAVEVGATEDAPDLRTTLRIPLVLLSGG